jgi:chromosome partitioning protein
MTVIAIVQQKGGVGKSTITANLAGELVEKRLIVRVLDLDPSRASQHGQEWAAEFCPRL